MNGGVEGRQRVNEARREPSRKHARILVVEDDADIAFFLTDTLEAEGYLYERVQ